MEPSSGFTEGLASAWDAIGPLVGLVVGALLTYTVQSRLSREKIAQDKLSLAFRLRYETYRQFEISLNKIINEIHLVANDRQDKWDQLFIEEDIERQLTDIHFVGSAEATEAARKAYGQLIMISKDSFGQAADTEFGEGPLAPITDAIERFISLARQDLGIDQ